MRLTLRTLLAYLDDVLDPADKEQLARKIESSDFAKDLVHQTRDSVRRLRLSAPQVIGAGMGMDPNSVAEYLDNALPPEQVGDYERICLESDVHLAETAACHHVLTMVLGEPAEVDPRSRQRMYMVPAEARERRRLRAEPAHARSVAPTAVSAPPAAGVPAVVRSQVPATNAFEVPEYLRTRSWWQSRAGLAALAAVLIIGTALFIVSDMMGWLGDGTPVAASGNGAPPSPKIANAEPDTDTATADAIPAPMETGLTAPSAETPSAPPATDLTTQEAALPETTAPAAVSAPQNATTEQVVSPITATPPVDNSLPTNTSAVEPAPPAAAEPASAVGTDASPQAAATAETTTAAVPPVTTPPEATPAVDAAASDASEAPADLPPAVEDTNPDPVAEATTPPELGTYLNGETVLLRFDTSKGGWFRVEPRSAVRAGERLLSLPEFRPQITLASGVMLDMSGGTQISMTAGDDAAASGQEADAAAGPMIEVLYGRIILTNTSNADSQVRIKAGAHLATATLEQNATLAVEVERPYVPGNDPRTTPAPVVAKIFAPNGGLNWADATAENVVEKPSRWTLAEGAPIEVIADSAPPEWIDREPVVHLSEQRYGAPAIERALVSDRPVDIQLLELFKGRDRREVKSLVTRSSIHVGLFAPFIDALLDPGQKWPTWRTHIETLRSAMAQSPESAELVFKALTDQHGRAAAAELYEMLCGYNAEQIGTTPDDVKSRALARLVDWLEKDSLDYRVLAVHNLWEITGKQLMPNPAANDTVRKQNIRRWRDRLKSGELVPVTQAE